MKEDSAIMKQYKGIKLKYPDAILLFRVGDFYESYNDDAITVSKALGIVLIKNEGGIENTSFPHFALETNLQKLVRAGHRVAICDQLEDPKKSNNRPVRRGVTDMLRNTEDFRNMARTLFPNY